MCTLLGCDGVAKRMTADEADVFYKICYIQLSNLSDTAVVELNSDQSR